MHRLQELVRLYRLGTGYREAARLLSMSPNTERAYRRRLLAAGLVDGEVDALPSLEELRSAVGPSRVPRQQASTLERWRPRVEALIEGGAGPQAIWDRLRLEEPEFEASLSATKRFVVRLEAERGVRAEDVAIPVETPPGHVGQVDFGYVGKLLDPSTNRLRKAYVFVLVLGFSRHMFARLVFDQRQSTWQRLHAAAFEALGGVVEVVVPDNLKAAVVRAAFAIDDDSVINQSYREVARHFGFKVDPTPPRAPKKKGKVESGVKYVKRNFIRTLPEEVSIDDANAQLARWVAEVAGQRRHGSTGKRPAEQFVEAEKAALLPLPAGPFEPAEWASPTLGRDCRFVFDGATYSAPWRHIGQRLLVRATSRELRVFADDARVATHQRLQPGGRLILDEHLPPGRRDLRHREPTYWFERASQLGDDVELWAREVMDSDDVLSKVRVLQAAIPYLETVGAPRAGLACRRASCFGAYRYGALKRILERGLESQPLPDDVLVPDDEPLSNPRFARDIRELLQLPLEAESAPN